MDRYALIGHPLTHSFSKHYFSKKFNSQSIKADYMNLDLNNLSVVKSTIENQEIKGFNVTIPYKESIINYLDNLTPNAQEIGAVNCVNIIDDKWIGHNTDIIGFENSLVKLITSHHKQALVLGSGGASKAVQFVLKKLDIPYKVVSRSLPKMISYSELPDTLEQFDIILNTTPLGTHPKIEGFPPIPYHEIKLGTICYDLVYNPEKSKFLELSEAQGAIIKNGLEMLQIQAEESWAIWNNRSELPNQ